MYSFEPPKQKIGQNFLGRIRSTLFVLGVKEWNMDRVMTDMLWQPLKRIGQWFRFLDKPWLSILGVIVVSVGGGLTYGGTTSHGVLSVVMWLSGILSILLFVRAYASKGRALVCWTQIFFGQLFVSLFLGILSGASVGTAMLYLSGIVVAYLVGVGCLVFLQRKMGPFTLLEFHGFMYAHPAIGDLFFIACLAMIAFPITPSFFGEEVLLSLTHVSHGAEMVLFAAGYVFLGISVMRLFAKVFFGPHKKTYHEIAYLTS
jgi:NADH:ubiquinone oxidoreductase subunit 4 (subunit M)